MKHLFRAKTSLALWTLAAVLVTVLVIYLTPLKHLNLVPASMHEIDPKSAYAAYEAHPDKYVLVDVRGSSAYAAAHVPGSINIPVADLATPGTDLSSRYAGLPRSGKQILLICGDGRLASIAYGYLEDHGFLNLLHLTGGIQNWAIEGLPVEGANIPAGIRQ